MKRCNITLVALVILVLSWPSSMVFAQGFSSILEKLDKLEKQLEQLEAGRLAPLEKRLQRLETTQKKDLTRLEKQLGTAPAATDRSDLDDAVAQLGTRLDDLTTKLEKQPQTASPSADVALVQGLETDLRALTGELRAAIDQATATGEVPAELTITGFVDASYGYDVASKGNSFGLDQVEVDVEQVIGDLGTAHADLEWSSDGEGGFALDAEQGYLTFQPAFLKGASLTFGKFNAPIGFELLDAPDMYQFSHALVFDYGLPTNLSGAMLSASLGASADWAFYVSNGWDENVDGNTGKTAGGRLGFSAGTFGAGLSAIHGTESAAGNTLTVIDVDLTATPSDNWTLGGEINYGRDKLDEVSCTWKGIMAMAHVDFSAWSGLTLRYDLFDDGDACRLGSGVGETRQALTVAPTFALGDGMGALVEFRTAFSDEKVFVDSDGQPAKSASALAFEMTYSF